MKNISIALGLILLIIAVLIFRPVPTLSENNAIIEKGIVSDIHEGGVNDIVFRLKNNRRLFYLNKGLEKGLAITSLKEKLIGKQVVLKYPKYWTPLDWNNSSRHISQVEFNNEILFNELRK